MAEKFTPSSGGHVIAITADTTSIYWLESTGIGTGPHYVMKIAR
jgi:hypothetical protein